MIEKEIEPSGKYKVNLTWLAYIPIMALLGIIPLVVRLVKVDILDESVLYITGNNIDFFSQAKSNLIFCMIIAMGLVLFFIFSKKHIKWDTQAKIYYISAGVFGLMTLVSMGMSEYSHIAKWGMPNRAEGTMMILCYLAMMLYTFYMIREERAMRYVIAPLCFLVVVMTVIGYFQYIGQDLLTQTELGQSIIVPEYYAEDREALSALYEKGNMYGTLFHYNYMGSFAAMMLPMFVTLTVFIKNNKAKVLFGGVSLCSAFLLFGSTSRAGLIGLGCSVVVFLVVFSRALFKRWKSLSIVLIGAIVLVVGLDAATGGKIFARIPTLVQDMVAIMQPADQNFDDKQNLPVQGITQEQGTVTIQIPNQAIQISGDQERLYFTDSNGNEIVYIYFDLGMGQPKYFTQDVGFERYEFLIEQNEESKRYYTSLYVDGVYVAEFEVTDEGLHMVNRYTKEAMAFVEPETIGFKGKEKLGSARGYIWSRSLPLLRETFLVGYGADTYAFEFPQDDLLGKWYAYGTPNMVVDKPHNMYLQIAINQGGIALVAFLVLVGSYLVQCVRLYVFKKAYESMHIVGISVMLAVVGYLGAGIFNDSVVSVAPIFWVLLGTGMAINYKVKLDAGMIQKKSAHGTISMKTRKHI